MLGLHASQTRLSRRGQRGRIGQRPADRVRERPGVALGYEPPSGAVNDDGSDTARISRDHRDTQRLGFEHRHAQWLPERGPHEQIAGADDSAQDPGRSRPQKDNPPGRRELRKRRFHLTPRPTAADYEQTPRQMGHTFERAGQQLERFRLAPGTHHRRAGHERNRRVRAHEPYDAGATARTPAEGSEGAGIQKGGKPDNRRTGAEMPLDARHVVRIERNDPAGARERDRHRAMPVPPRAMGLPGRMRRLRDHVGNPESFSRFSQSGVVHTSLAWAEKLHPMPSIALA